MSYEKHAARPWKNLDKHEIPWNVRRRLKTEHAEIADIKEAGHAGMRESSSVTYRIIATVQGGGDKIFEVKSTR